jgi:hypothetical protein
MNKNLLFLIVILFLLPSAKGQIGSTIEQCKQHYGEATEIEFNADANVKGCRFENPPDGSTGGDYDILAFFTAGKCDCIIYHSKDFEQRLSHISAKQIEILLRLNSNGYIWTRVSATSKEIDYSAHLDGKVVMQAFYANKEGLMIATSDWFQKNQ